MADVRVRRDDYEDGALPDVCVRTGAPAEVLVGHKSTRGVGWWGLLLLVFGPAGLIALVVLDRIVRREARGLLPASRAAVAASAAARRRWDRIVISGLVVAGAGALVALLAEGRVVDLGIGGLVVGLGAAAVAWFAPALAQVQGTPEPSGGWIELAGVSSAFAAAYEAQDAVRADAHRRAVASAPASPVRVPADRA